MAAARVRHLTGVLLLAVLVAAVAATGWTGTAVADPSKKGGNSENAKACHKGGWEGLVRSDGSAFASEEECVSYAAQGGTLQEKQEEFTNVGPTLLDLVSPDRPPYVEGTDYQVMPGSGSGDVTARLVPIDITLAPGADATNNPQPVDTSSSGCEQADYDAAGFQPGDVALIQRGTCSLDSKVNVAIANGATVVVIFNEGQAPDRTTFDFGPVVRVGIPVLSTSYAVAYELYQLTQAGPVTIHVVTNTQYS